MRPRVEFCEIKVAAREEGPGLLVIMDGWLVAVLVQLSGHHGDLSGQWFLESGYGRFSEVEQITFPTVQLAETWFVDHLADGAVNDPWL